MATPSLSQSSPRSSALQPISPARIAARRGVRLLGICVAMLAGLTLVAPSASADPPVPESASEAAQLVAQLGRDLEILQEEQNEAQVTLENTVVAAGTARAALITADAAVASMDGQVRSVARSAFGGDRLGSLSALLTSGSPTEFLDRVNTLEQLSVHNGGLLAQATAAREEAAGLTADAEQAVAAATATSAEIEQRRVDLDGQIAEYEALYAELSVVEQEAVTGGPAEAVEGDPSADNAADDAADNAGGVPPGPVVAPTEAARVAVEAAYAQLGDSYVYGAGGPDSFDCSGLTSYVYAQAGVSIPHSSSSQSRMGIPVSQSELQPGDLVFMYSPVSHVGIYVGNGQIIHAYNSGSPVSLDPVDPWGAYNSARRIVG